MNAEEAYQRSVDNMAIKNAKDVHRLIEHITRAVNSSVEQGYTSCYFRYFKYLEYSISPRETPKHFLTVRKHFEDLGYSFRIYEDSPSFGNTSVSMTIDWRKKPEVPTKKRGFLRRIWSKE